MVSDNEEDTVEKILHHLLNGTKIGFIKTLENSKKCYKFA